MTVTNIPTAPGAELAIIDPNELGALPERVSYARELAESGLLPAAFRKNPANVLWAIEYATMLNLTPMAAIVGIHVIEGKPSASSALMSALVRRAGHRLRVSGNDEKAIVEIVRHDDPEFTFRAEWTEARARKADLFGKGTWKKYPAAMLKARAISECARDACEEALLGMHYTPEELGADVDEDGAPVRAAAVRIPTFDEDHSRDPEPDWDDLIQRHEGNADRAGLAEVRALARGVRPNDGALLERIALADERVKRHQLKAAAVAIEEFRARALAPAASRAELLTLMDDVKRADLWKAPVDGEDNQPTTLEALIVARGKIAKEREERRPAPEPPGNESILVTREYLEAKDRRGLEAHLFALLGEGGVTDTAQGRETRLLVMSRLCNVVPRLTTSADLPDSDVINLILTLDRYRREGTLAEELARMSAPSPNGKD